MMILASLFFLLVHPYHVSVCDVVYDDEEKSLQITHRIFEDDLQLALSEYAGSEINLKENPEKANRALSGYLESHFSISVDGIKKKIEFIGFEIEDEAVWCYLESMPLGGTEIIDVRNTILMDDFSDQQNILHFKFPQDKKSFILESGKSEASYIF